MPVTEKTMPSQHARSTGRPNSSNECHLLRLPKHERLSSRCVPLRTQSSKIILKLVSNSRPRLT
eukprot:4323378-Prymnesium_polylepis.1